MPFGDFLVLDKTREDAIPCAGLFLLSYSPELNLIERPWKVTKRCALYGRYQPTFRDFQVLTLESHRPVVDSEKRRAWFAGTGSR